MSNKLKSLYLWFDTSKDLVPAGNKYGINWLRCSPFLVIHLCCLGAFFVPFHKELLYVLALTYSARVFSLTAFYHRLFSHRAFKTSRVVQFIFAFIGTSAAQRGPLWWSAHHRHHHKHSDDPNDRHSPKVHGLLWSHCGWFLANDNFKTDQTFIKDLLRYPELRLLDRFDSLPPLILAITLYLIGGLPYLIWGFFISTVLIYHVTFCVNSIAHVIGTRRYETKDDSKNNWLLALFTFGEGWHNNHHHHPSSARQGETFWEIDISYIVLKVMQKFGLVWDLREPEIYAEVPVS